MSTVANLPRAKSRLFALRLYRALFFYHTIKNRCKNLCKKQSAFNNDTC